MKPKEDPEQVDPIQILLPDVLKTVRDPDLRLIIDRISAPVGVILLAAGVLSSSEIRELLILLGSIHLSGSMISENNTREELGLPHIGIKR